MTLNTWNHVGFSYDAVTGIATLNINGVSETHTDPTWGDTSTRDNIFIGSR